MKNIAFVFDGMGFGGIERVGTDYIRICVGLGYQVDVYNLNPSAYEFAKNNLPQEVKYIPYKLSRKGCPETYTYGIQRWWWGKYAYPVISPIISLKQIIEKVFIRKKEYDVAIAMAGHINDLSFVAKNYINAKKKIVWCHGNVISYLAICDAYSILYRKIDSIVTLSSAGEKDIYGGKKYLYEKTIKKIYNPTFICSKVISTAKVEKLKSEYGDFILYVARFEPRKGQDIAIKVVKRLKEKGFDKNILFAGDGFQKKEIIELAEKEKIRENCVFLGNCSDMENYISASYINLLCSKWEGLPTVIIEAMSLGKPCVMTNSDDGEVSGNGKYCILNEIDDVEGISESLKLLYENKDMYQKYVELAIERSKAFQPETIKKELIRLLDV